MTTAVALRFPAGRYHATPWGRSVNEAAPEWPPSPWRLLRALYATWQWRAPGLAADQVEAAFAGLTAAPSFRLPRHAEAHTRHYYPDAAYGTDKVFDPFVVFDPAAEVLVRWPGRLDPAQREVVARLCTLLPYLGRADSLCQARLLDDEEASVLPAGGWLDPGDLGGLERPATRVLAPTSPLDLADLLATTTAVRRAGRTSPPGARWLTYATPRVERPASTVVVRETQRVQAVRLALNAPVLPTALQAVHYGDVLRAAALSNGGTSPTLSGRVGDGVRADGHRHAHYVVVDDDGDGLLDTAVVWAQEGLAEADVAALSRVRHLHHGEPGFRPVRLAVEAGGEVAALLPRLTGWSSTWVSATPFVPYRHPRKQQALEDYLLGELARELATRALPEPASVALMAGPWLGYRRRRSLRDREARAFGLRVQLTAPVGGPLLLGALSHFGLGRFEAGR